MAGNDLSNRAKVQNILDNNTTRAGGDFHCDVLDEDSFVMDLHKKFKITPVNDVDVDKTLNSVIKRSTVRVRGLIDAKELKQRKFIKQLFEQFKIELK